MCSAMYAYTLYFPKPFFPLHHQKILAFWTFDRLNFQIVIFEQTGWDTFYIPICLDRKFARISV